MFPVKRLHISRQVAVASALVEGVSIDWNLPDDRRCEAHRFKSAQRSGIQKTLRLTPAMHAGIADHACSLEEPVALLEQKKEEQAA